VNRLPEASLRELPRLALPLIASSGVQIVLGLTDTWFVGRISTDALAAISSVQWLSLVTILLVGGASLASGLLASRAAGSGRFRRAANAAWTCIWAVLIVTPVFGVLAFFGGPLLSLLDLDRQVTALAVDYWFPRLLGAPLGLALAVIGGFFNGIGKTQVAMVMALVVAVGNALLNQLFIFEWGLGLAGAAWATNAAQAIGLALLLRYFLNARNRRRYRTHASWRTSPARLREVYRLGMPLGFLFACDVFAFALFQLLQVKYSPVHGAATQVAMQLVAVSYLIGAGIAETSALLVSRAVGEGNLRRARRIGNHVILLLMALMGSLGLLMALLGPWIVPLFVGAGGTDAPAVVALAVQLLWIGALYQVADGLYLGSEYALRGAGDVRFTATVVFISALFVMTPLAHTLTFAPGVGYFDAAPGLGMGAHGGWAALVVHITLLAAAAGLRWRSVAWEARANGAGTEAGRSR
jgi:multidrug resistance protein, MATE family